MKTTNKNLKSLYTPLFLVAMLAVWLQSVGCSAVGKAAALSEAPRQDKVLSRSGELTPDDTAVLLVDFQVNLMEGVKFPDPATLKNNAIALAKIAKVFELPTFILGGNDYLGPQLEEILSVHPKAPRFSRTTISAWKDPAIVAAVAASGRKKLLIAGVSTDMCVALTALDALRAGYEVYLVTDASGTHTKMAEESALLRLTQAGVTTVTWVSLGAELLGDWASPKAEAVRAVMGEHMFNRAESSEQ